MDEGLLKAEEHMELLELDVAKGLRENVIVSGAVLKGDIPGRHCLSNEVEVNVNMLGAAMECRGF